MWKKVWGFCIEKNIFKDLFVIIVIITVLIGISGFCNCAAPEKPDTVTVLQDAKEAVKEGKALQKNSDKVDPRVYLPTMDKLTAALEKLIHVTELQDSYIAFLKKKVDSLENSIQYKIGSYVVWIISILIALVVLYFGVRLVALNSPGGWVAKILRFFAK